MPELSLKLPGFKGFPQIPEPVGEIGERSQQSLPSLSRRVVTFMNVTCSSSLTACLPSAQLTRLSKACALKQMAPVMFVVKD